MFTLWRGSILSVWFISFPFREGERERGGGEKTRALGRLTVNWITFVCALQFNSTHKRTWTKKNELPQNLYTRDIYVSSFFICHSSSAILFILWKFIYLFLSACIAYGFCKHSLACSFCKPKIQINHISKVLIALIYKSSFLLLRKFK